MTKGKGSRFSNLPNDLKKILYFFGILIIWDIISVVILWPVGLFSLILDIPIIIVAWGIYQLKPWARKISIWVLSIIAFFAFFRIFNLIFGLFTTLSLSITTGAHGLFITFLLANLVYPILVFYMLYLISNDDVKQYFDYPEMVEQGEVSSKKEKKEEKEYQSFDF